jgi:hypothetical protein
VLPWGIGFQDDAAVERAAPPHPSPLSPPPCQVGFRQVRVGPAITWAGQSPSHAYYLHSTRVPLTLLLLSTPLIYRFSVERTGRPGGRPVAATDGVRPVTGRGASQQGALPREGVERTY